MTDELGSARRGSGLAGWSGHPSTPAYLTLAGCASAAVLLTQWQVSLAILVWALLGVAAGYSISGSP